MSEIKLNLIDAQQVLCGTIHGSVAEAVVAALSAEPETIAELKAALGRFQKPDPSYSPFPAFWTRDDIDDVPWDAGIVVIDLAARIVAIESTYSRPGPQGQVRYHDGTQSTDVSVHYQLPDDWIFVDSIEEYKGLSDQRRDERAAHPPLDARAVLYGRPLLEWIVRTVNSDEGGVIWSALARQRFLDADDQRDASKLETSIPDNGGPDDASVYPISMIHARWLMTARDDLRGQSPREVLFEKRDFIDFDLNSRELQWSLLDEGPPCLSLDSFAYRYAGFGIHEWVIYYDMVRHLIWSAFLCQRLSPDDIQKWKIDGDIDAMSSLESAKLVDEAFRKESARVARSPEEVELAIAELEEIKARWLERPNGGYEKIPAVLIENERKRLPIAMSPSEMIVDEDCPTCQMMANDPSFGVGFWHLDGCNMDDGFPFSHLRTREEWEAERADWRAFSEKFNHEWEERQQKIARGESLEDFENGVPDLDSSDSEVQPTNRSWGPRGWSIS